MAHIIETAQVKMDKQAHIHTLISHYKSLQEASTFCDVFFVCEDSVVSAHKSMLAPYSPKLLSPLFDEEVPREPSTIFLKGIESKDLQVLMTFIYTGRTVCSKNFETIIKMLDIVLPSDAISVEPVSDSNIDKATMHVCTICDKKFSMWVAMKSHMEKHNQLTESSQPVITELANDEAEKQPDSTPEPVVPSTRPSTKRKSTGSANSSLSKKLKRNVQPKESSPKEKNIIENVTPNSTGTRGTRSRSKQTNSTSKPTPSDLKTVAGAFVTKSKSEPPKKSSTIMENMNRAIPNMKPNVLLITNSSDSDQLLCVERSDQGLDFREIGIQVQLEAKIDSSECVLCTHQAKNFVALQFHISSHFLFDEDYSTDPYGHVKCPKCHIRTVKRALPVHMLKTHADNERYMPVELMKYLFKIDVPNKKKGGNEKPRMVVVAKSLAEKKCYQCDQTFEEETQIKTYRKHLVNKHLSCHILRDYPPAIRDQTHIECPKCHNYIKNGGAYLLHLGIGHGLMLKYMPQELKGRFFPDAPRPVASRESSKRRSVQPTRFESEN